jgi:hypothetical protein
MFWVLAVATACGSHKTAVVGNHTGAAAAAGSGERAYVIDGGSLVEVTATGSRVLAEDVDSCNTDARAQVVWFANGSGASAFDLADGQVHPIIKQALAVKTPDDVEHTRIELIIDWGEHEKLGGESALDFDVGIAVKMTSKPALEMVEGCDGDRAVYCMDENGKPTQNVLDAQKQAQSLRLADPAYVAKLATRGVSGHLWAAAPAAQPPKGPDVDRSHCQEMPEDCGALTPVPGTSLWLVSTENSRGDYFHLTRELWDPATKEFIVLDKGALRRTPQPPYDNDSSTDYGGLRVSPSGLMSFRGVVFDAKHVLYAPKESGETCGFVGGYRIKGPTDF